MRSLHEQGDEERAGVVDMTEGSVVKELQGISCLYALRGLTNVSILPGG